MVIRIRSSYTFLYTLINLNILSRRVNYNRVRERNVLKRYIRQRRFILNNSFSMGAIYAYVKNRDYFPLFCSTDAENLMIDERSVPAHDPYAVCKRFINTYLRLITGRK